MKPRKITNPGVALTATAIALFYSTLAIAGDPLPLIGKDLDQNRDWVNSVMQGRNYMVEVDRQGKIKQIIDAGANGDGKDPGQDAKSAAHAKPTGLDVASADLPENYEGQGAVDYIGIDLPKVAAQYGLTPDKFKDMLLHDATIRVDINKRLFYVDTAIEQQGQNPGIKASVVGATASGYSSTDPSVPIASTAALANAFKLHSKPGASKTIYLDFDGYVATKTAWSSTTISAPAYD